jgi:hypothetical protein
MTHKIISVTPAAAVATNGTIASIPYPAGMGASSFAAWGHKAFIEGLQYLASSPIDFTLTLGATITFTWKGSTSIPAGTRVEIQVNIAGTQEFPAPLVGDDLVFAPIVKINLGAPVVADADGILDGVTATTTAQTYDTDDFIIRTLDVPRNITATGSAGSNHVVTISGTDEFGVAMSEALTLDGTNVIAGKKAFKTLTEVAVAAGAADDTVDIGYGDVFGLPRFLPGAGFVLRELQDGAAPTAGTLVAGVSSAATATTGDVRGTYDPNAAADGAKVFALLVALEDPEYKGVAQYSA